jgi:hypothetical protein
MRQVCKRQAQKLVSLATCDELFVCVRNVGSRRIDSRFTKRFKGLQGTGTVSNEGGVCVASEVRAIEGRCIE